MRTSHTTLKPPQSPSFVAENRFAAEGRAIFSNHQGHKITALALGRHSTGDHVHVATEPWICSQEPGKHPPLPVRGECRWSSSPASEVPVLWGIPRTQPNSCSTHLRISTRADPRRPSNCVQGEKSDFDGSWIFCPLLSWGRAATELVGLGLGLGFPSRVVGPGGTGWLKPVGLW